ncbi:tetratricopeptide repeat protein [Flavobacterium sp. RHBU_3]|uniref:tetratricopeptide repeat protein n=1 Tax=Flavobacterium sp. RHBU_3 TaxID=3391184 RepID=UPI003985044E
MKTKSILFYLLALCNYSLLLAQKDGLYYNKEYYQCENKWVALPQKEGDDKYLYGVVYLDGSAGYTFDYQGDFTVVNNKFVRDNKPRESSMKYRIETRWAKLAILPDEKIKEMGLPTEPDWLKIYREGENDTDRLYRKGYLLNEIGGCQEAIPVLLQAYAKEPEYKGVLFELAFAYNATEQFEKAIEILKKGIAKEPKNYMFYRELGYAYVQSGNVSEAEKIYTKGIALSTDKSQNAEMAFNMAGHYYRVKDKTNFAKWAAIVKKNSTEDTHFLENLTIMENELK